ncbi:MAG: sugar phosphate isomerase/epimerase [bacterium]|nr:sugar phosphate isomerase/epimerase [bacterium]
MKLMICLRGELEQLACLPEIAELGAGIELGSYGLIGIQSERDWETRFAQHKAVRNRFQGPIAIHGPFIGMEYGHIDYLIRDVVNRRLGMTFDVAVKLNACRVVLHSGYRPTIELFNIQDDWLKRGIAFWRQEIRRWADAGIEIVLENETETSPDIPVRLVNDVDSPFLGLCLDVGHQHMFSELDAVKWVQRMACRLSHIHLHDNDRTGDKHWSIGRGTIDFESFYAALLQHAPQVTISLETVDTMPVKMGDLRKLAAHFASSADTYDRDVLHA